MQTSQETDKNQISEVLCQVDKILERKTKCGRERSGGKSGGCPREAVTEVLSQDVTFEQRLQ